MRPEPGRGAETGQEEEVEVLQVRSSGPLGVATAGPPTKSAIDSLASDMTQILYKSAAETSQKVVAEPTTSFLLM